MYKVELENGKYTVQHNNGTDFKALRNGEEWRDLTGDGLILALVQHIESLKEKLQESDNRASQFADYINMQAIRFGKTEDLLIRTVKLLRRLPVDEKYLEASCNYDETYNELHTVFLLAEDVLGRRYEEVYMKVGE